MCIRDRRPADHNGRAGRRGNRGGHRGGAARRVPGVVPMIEPFEDAAVDAGSRNEQQLSGEAAGPEGPDAPAELTESMLEALLFVAEKPLSRREIATLAGVDRATVDDRLG